MSHKTLANIHGVTERFAGNGRKLGYPTANIAANTALHDGIYFGFASLGDYSSLPALIFIGTPTTIGDTKRRVEAYLLDIIDKDYYDLELELDIQHFHRPNQTLGSIKELVEIMKSDEVTARQWFKNHTGHIY